MNLFARTQRLVSSTLHSWLDRLENPEALARHSLRDFTAAIEAATAAVARSIAAERWLANRRDQTHQQVDHADQEASLALQRGDETEAKRTLRAKHDLIKSRDDLDVQLANARSQNDSLRSQLRRLQERYREAKFAVEQQSIRRTVANSRMQLVASEQASLQLDAVAPFEANLDRLAQATLQREAEAELIAELSVNVSTPLEARREAFVERELRERRV